MDINENEWIDKDTVRFFIWSVKNFFTISTDIEPEVGAPYLFDAMEYESYTGIIGVSGSQKGAVYFNIGKNLLDEILKITYPHMSNQEDLNEKIFEEMRMDYTGEITNIISGNVRNYMGENFLISVPVVVTAEGKPMKIPNSTQAIIFPINWQGHQCHLILSLEHNKPVTDEQSELLERML